MNWAYEYPNIFRCPRFEQTNIQINLDAQDLAEQIYKYICTAKRLGVGALNTFLRSIITLKSGIPETLNFLTCADSNTNKKSKKTILYIFRSISLSGVICQVSFSMFHALCVMRYAPCVMYHMSHATCHLTPLWCYLWGWGERGLTHERPKKNYARRGHIYRYMDIVPNRPTWPRGLSLWKVGVFYFMKREGDVFVKESAIHLITLFLFEALPKPNLLFILKGLSQQTNKMFLEI